MKAARPILYAVYDLSRAPITFDVMNFLAMARVWSLRGDFAGYHLIIVLNDAADGFRRLTPKDMMLSRDEKLWRLRHILMGHEAIARGCVGMTLLQGREELARLLRTLHSGQVFPPAYSLERPTTLFLLHQVFAMKPSAEELLAFEATPSALRRAKEWLSNKGAARPVTLTLRGSPYEEWRNSRVEDWLAAADHMRERGFDPVIIPDHDLAIAGLDAFGSHLVFTPGAIDLDLRVAMYAISELNMAHNGGPAFLAYFMGVAMICFLPVDALPGAASTIERMAQLLGVTTGGQFPHASPGQQLVWQAADRDSLIQAFEQAAASGPTSRS